MKLNGYLDPLENIKVRERGGRGGSWNGINIARSNDSEDDPNRKEVRSGSESRYEDTLGRFGAGIWRDSALEHDRLRPRETLSSENRRISPIIATGP